MIALYHTLVHAVWLLIQCNIANSYEPINNDMVCFMKHDPKNSMTTGLLWGTVLGLLFGVILGTVVFDSMAYGMGIGLLFGVVLGLLLGTIQTKK